MKSNKLAFAAIATVLALWAANAQAQVLGRFEKLNFSLVAMQQEIDDYEPPGPYGNVLLPKMEISKITSKDLLKYLATALNTNWPAGAQLALGEQEVPGGGQGFFPGSDFNIVIVWDIFVVDKTGTNPVFDVSTGINVGDTNVVYFSYDTDGPVVSSKSVRVEKLGESLNSTTNTAFGKIFFHFFNEQNGITNTDLYFDGLNTIESHFNSILTANKIIEYGTASEQAPVTGDGTFNNEWTVVKGKVTGSIKWKENLILLQPGPPILTNGPTPILFTNTPMRLPTNWPPPIFTNIPILLNP